MAVVGEPARAVVTPLTEDMWPAVSEIYAAGIATGHATFEAEPPTWDAFDAGRLPQHRLAALGAGEEVLAFVAASAVSERCVYAGVVEHSIYVAAAARGRGVGRVLLHAFVASTEAAGIWTIQSGIFPENTASLALHRGAGFREVGTRSRLGRMAYGPLAGRWRDVILLERRSSITGV